ncbi:cell volume regulation protein A [Deinobacterium chartae]|uniref:Cell volume regulation protein A n=1 Tax=Deinobacterium chartae TaxID=521158 RepID=A0A841HTV9_9DEIO|nr:cell volume regulation protein A [Deinobacterium chartae]
MHQIETAIFGAALLGLLSIIATKVSGRLGIPGLLVFLAIGMLAGSEGLGGIDFDDPLAAQFLGILGLSFILFSGGLATQWRTVRPVLGPGLALATLGVAFTTLLVGLFATWLLGISLVEGLLLGAVVSSTDASAVFSVLRERALGLKGQVKPLLEFESGINDPMAVFLTIGLTELALHPEQSGWTIVPMFLRQMLLGGLLGLLLGRASVWLVNRLNLPFDGLYPVLTVMLVLLIYGLSAALGGSGFLAVYLAAVVMGNSEFIHKRSLTQFHEGITQLFEIGLFLALGLLVFPSQLLSVATAALLISLFLMFVARPISVYLSLLPWPMKKREKSMVAWVGLRGAVPIVLATFPLLERAPGANLIFNIAFFIVLTSVLLQGTTLPLVARLLRVSAPLPEKTPLFLEYTPTGAGRNDLVEVNVPHGSSVVGRRIVDLHFPKEALIVLIHRGGQFIIPRGATTLEGGDSLQILAHHDALREVRARVAERAALEVEESAGPG